MTVVIAGASLAGLRTAEALRKYGYDQPIVLLGDEPELPYDRPPLSKEHLDAEKAPEPVLLRKESDYDELELTLRLGVRATGVDVHAKVLHTDEPDDIAFDHLVIATGGTPRQFLPGAGVDGFHVVRTLADANALRVDLARSPRVLVLGGGFIGAEVACAARKRGLDVTMVETLEAPLSRALGTRVGMLLANAHSDNGVDLRCGVTVTDVRGQNRIEEVTLTDGTVVKADVVVVGMGVDPATNWLDGTDLDIVNGVLCDQQLRALGHESIYAVGDVARWPNKASDETMRVEHWSNANEHAEVVASAIVGNPRSSASVPYVWSDQYGSRIQIVGRPRAEDDLTLVENSDTGRHVAAFERAGALVGIMAVNSPRHIIKARRAIAARNISAADFLASLEKK